MKVDIIIVLNNGLLNQVKAFSNINKGREVLDKISIDLLGEDHIVNETSFDFVDEKVSEINDEIAMDGKELLWLTNIEVQE